MNKFLPAARRVFLCGTISLIILIILRFTQYQGLRFRGSDQIGKWFMYFTFASPVLWIIFWLTSTAYMRKQGRFAASHQQKPFISSMGKNLVSDLTFPFRMIGRQFHSRKKQIDYYSNVVPEEIAVMIADGSIAINRLKLIRAIYVLLICAFGILCAVPVFRAFHF